MIIKTIALSSVLASCPIPRTQPMVTALRLPALPVQEWPESQERPEKTEPPHGENSGESPMFGGMAVYGTASINIANTAGVTVDSGASGFGPYVSVTWLPNHLPLVVSTSDLDVEPSVPASRPNVMFKADSRKNVANPSTTETRRYYTRRQR